MAEEKKKDILDELRDVEKFTRTALLSKQLSKIKTLARERLESMKKFELLYRGSVTGETVSISSASTGKTVSFSL